MSVSIEDVLSHAGYDVLHDIEDARWLLSNKEEIEELINKATDLQDDYEEYEWDMQEMEDSGDTGHKVSFKEWLEIKNSKLHPREKIELKFPEMPTLR